MAEFLGTAEEFNKFIGPFVRNLVQNKSRPWKVKADKRCEGLEGLTCNHQGQLEAAHSSKLPRVLIIKNVYDKLAVDGVIDLNVAIKEIEELHTRDSMRLLCKPCHDKYDGRSSAVKKY